MMTRTESKNQNASFDGLSETLAAHPSRSQILVGVQAQGNTLERALEVLDEMNLKPIRQEIVQKDSSACILMLLPNENMNEAVLKLSEAGFTKVKGINAESHYPGKGSTFRISPSGE
ncbi:MAG: hypothetical protein K9N10_01645 [Deltaproteobacteria bacterium]|nr:hypothetical protein [Deltaproteobacteria bacterium]